LRVIHHIPTVLTMSRLVLGLGFAWAYSAGVSPWWLFVMVAVAGITDWLDGLTARQLKVVSTLGKLLDPFADALFCMIVFFAVMQRDGAVIVPVWVFCVLVGREAIVTFILRPVALVRKLVIAASWWGKIKTILQFAVILACVALEIDALKKLEPLLMIVARVGVYLVLFFSVTAALLYVQKTLDALKQKKTVEDDTAS
jgi:CDP-diacylglycerol---glycerol-3-phosphate 3-phosphatidyltransferase